MKDSVKQLSSVEDCDTAIAVTQEEKSVLENRKTNLVFRLNTFSKSSQEVEAQIISLQALLTAKTSEAEALPAGKEKDIAMNEKKEMEVDLFKLQMKKEKYGVLAVVEKDLDIIVTDTTMALFDAHISELQERKVELQNAA